MNQKAKTSVFTPGINFFFFFISVISLIFIFSCSDQKKKSSADSDSFQITIQSNQHAHSEAMATHTMDKTSWSKRKEASIERLNIGMGLFPFLRATPQSVTPVYHVVGEKTFEGFKIQNITIRLFKGFYIFGNLYIPTGQTPPFPAILNPHGHFPDGRFNMDHINNIPQRCANFARLGMVAFTYDLIGYGESNQVSHWGHDYTVNQELTGFIPMGIETWKAVTCIDFLCSLPYVNKDKIGITGASGAGHISVVAGCLDERIRLVAPVNNPFPGSDAQYCCTGTPFMFDINECELAALVSPKPMMIVSNQNDFTKDFPGRCLPILEKIYRWNGFPDHLTHHRQHVIHGYNQQAREWAVQFFARRFLNRPIHYKETSSGIRREDIQLFKNQEKYPEDYQRGIHQVLSSFEGEVLQQQKSWVSGLLETDLPLFTQYYQKITGVLFWKEVPGTIRSNEKNPEYYSKHTETVIQIGSDSRKYQIPVILYRESFSEKQKPAILLISDYGKNLPPDIIKKFIPTHHIYAADLFEQGHLKESISWSDPHKRTIKGGKYLRTLGFSAYDPTSCARKINDIILIERYLHSKKIDSDTIGLGRYGPILLLARTQYHSTGTTVIDMNQFQDNLQQWSDSIYFIPLIIRYGGIGTVSNLIFPERLIIFNSTDDETLRLLKKTYRKSRRQSNLEISSKKLSLNDILQKIINKSIFKNQYFQ